MVMKEDLRNIIKQVWQSGGVGRDALREELDEIKPARAAPVQELSAVSIPASDKAEFTVTNTDGYSAVAVTVKSTYDALATAGARVRWLYSPDGTNFDSEDDAESAGNYEDLTFSAGSTRVRTTLVPLFQPFVRVQIVNLDTSYACVVDAWRTNLR